MSVTNAGYWGRALYGPKAVPFGLLPAGATFRFPTNARGDVFVKRTKTGKTYFSLATGARYLTGLGTATLPVEGDA